MCIRDSTVLFQSVAIQSFWSLINMIQVLSYLPLLNLSIPSNLEIFLDEYLSFKGLTFPFDIFPKLSFGPEKFAELFSTEAFGELFGLHGFESFNFLYVFCDELFTWLLMGLGYVALNVLYRIIKKSRYFLFTN
eukprot:TRINITY_DN6930_c0_g2_i1.p1 TRINITY_DN6930_c0_g2~~TRINITY_DN6930_c0_g2_i1.p1  ORF type:complete len:134 (+),score=13.30 TRINITY_DN6930_c0_g2_i1:75-476(+)